MSNLVDSSSASAPRVLVVDDDPVNQMIARTIFEQIGCVVDLANHGKDAVDKCDQSEYTAIVMDIDMPEMNGIEATLRIRNQLLARNVRVPLIAAWTADHSESKKKQCLDAGMTKFFLKPTRIPELRAEFSQLVAEI